MISDERDRARADEAFRELAKEQAEVRRLRSELALVATGTAGAWFWQGDGEDHPESLSCPVVMSAETLRTLVAANKQARAGLDVIVTGPARSWTGRVCVENHDCRAPIAVHRSEDGVRWRGNADDVVDGGARELPFCIRAAFLGYIESHALGNEAAAPEQRERYARFFRLMTDAVGVVIAEQPETEAYWSGPWPSNQRDWAGYDPEQMDARNRYYMVRGMDWGCSVETTSFAVAT